LQGPQPGCQHQWLNCKPAKLEMLQNKISKTKKNKKIKKFKFSLKHFKFGGLAAKPWRVRSHTIGIDGMAAGQPTLNFFQRKNLFFFFSNFSLKHFKFDEPQAIPSAPTVWLQACWL
jgi:hypothetical protein